MSIEPKIVKCTACADPDSAIAFADYYRLEYLFNLYRQFGKLYLHCVTCNRTHEGGLSLKNAIHNWNCINIVSRHNCSNI